MPVSRLVLEMRCRRPKMGDTTGAGDNFVGGLLSSLIDEKYVIDFEK